MSEIATSLVPNADPNPFKEEDEFHNHSELFYFKSGEHVEQLRISEDDRLILDDCPGSIPVQITCKQAVQWLKKCLGAGCFVQRSETGVFENLKRFCELVEREMR